MTELDTSWDEPVRQDADCCQSKAPPAPDTGSEATQLPDEARKTIYRVPSDE